MPEVDCPVTGPNLGPRRCSLLCKPLASRRRRIHGEGGYESYGGCFVLSGKWLDGCGQCWRLGGGDGYSVGRDGVTCESGGCDV